MTFLIVSIRHRLIALTTVPFWLHGGLPHWKGWWPSPGPSGNWQSAPTNNPQPHRQLWGKSLGKPRWLNDFPQTTRRSLVSWNLSRSFSLFSQRERSQNEAPPEEIPHWRSQTYKDRCLLQLEKCASLKEKDFLQKVPLALSMASSAVAVDVRDWNPGAVLQSECSFYHWSCCLVCSAVTEYLRGSNVREDRLI